MGFGRIQLNERQGYTYGFKHFFSVKIVSIVTITHKINLLMMTIRKKKKNDMMLDVGACVWTSF